MLPVDNTRRFFIEENEVDALVEAVPKDGLSDYVAWLAATGQRKREASLMTWTMVEGNERITVPKAICKNKSDRVILLSRDLLDIIESRRAARPYQMADGTTAMSSYIFHCGDGKQICLFRKSWFTACKKIGRPELHVHDLRRVAARRLLRAEIHISRCKKIVGWKSDAMFERYAIYRRRRSKSSAGNRGNVPEISGGGTGGESGKDRFHVNPSSHRNQRKPEAQKLPAFLLMRFTNFPVS